MSVINYLPYSDYSEVEQWQIMKSAPGLDPNEVQYQRLWAFQGNRWISTVRPPEFGIVVGGWVKYIGPPDSSYDGAVAQVTWIGKKIGDKISIDVKLYPSDLECIGLNPMYWYLAGAPEAELQKLEQDKAANELRQREPWPTLETHPHSLGEARLKWEQKYGKKAAFAAERANVEEYYRQNPDADPEKQVEHGESPSVEPGSKWVRVDQGVYDRLREFGGSKSPSETITILLKSSEGVRERYEEMEALGHTLKLLKANEPDLEKRGSPIKVADEVLRAYIAGKMIQPASDFPNAPPVVVSTTGVTEVAIKASEWEALSAWARKADQKIQHNDGWMKVAIESNKAVDAYLRSIRPLPEHYGMPVDGVRMVLEALEGGYKTQCLRFERLETEYKAIREVLDSGKATLAGLLNYIKVNCYPDTPALQIDSELGGMLSQLDNMLAGVVPMAQAAGQQLNSEQDEGGFIDAAAIKIMPWALANSMTAKATLAGQAPKISINYEQAGMLAYISAQALWNGRLRYKAGIFDDLKAGADKPNGAGNTTEAKNTDKSN